MENNQNYTPEFRAEAVKLVLVQGLSQAEAAKRLSIPKGTIANWVANAKASKVSTTPGTRTAEELEAELKPLRRELAEARMERDILKKATAYFAKESLQGNAMDSTHPLNGVIMRQACRAGRQAGKHKRGSPR
jgi:transposase